MKKNNFTKTLTVKLVFLKNIILRLIFNNYQ